MSALPTLHEHSELDLTGGDRPMSASLLGGKTKIIDRVSDPYNFDVDPDPDPDPWIHILV